MATHGYLLTLVETGALHIVNLSEEELEKENTVNHKSSIHL